MPRGLKYVSAAGIKASKKGAEKTKGCEANASHPFVFSAGRSYSLAMPSFSINSYSVGLLMPNSSAADVILPACRLSAD